MIKWSRKKIEAESQKIHKQKIIDFLTPLKPVLQQTGIHAPDRNPLQTHNT